MFTMIFQSFFIRLQTYICNKYSRILGQNQWIALKLVQDIDNHGYSSIIEIKCNTILKMGDIIE